MGYERASFAIDATGRAITLPSALVRVDSWGEFEIPIDNALWGRVIGDFIGGRLPPQHDLLWLDAHYHIRTGDVRRALLDASIACEQAKTQFLHRKAASRAFTGTDLAAHVGRDLQRRFGYSFDRDHPAEYQAVAEMWICRGSEAHGKPALDVESHDDLMRMYRFLKAARVLIDWLGTK
jgi:hypothetical protein